MSVQSSLPNQVILHVHAGTDENVDWYTSCQPHNTASQQYYGLHMPMMLQNENMDCTSSVIFCSVSANINIAHQKLY